MPDILKKFYKKANKKRSTGILLALAITFLLLILAPSKSQIFAQEYKSNKEMAKLQKKWSGIKSWQADYRETYHTKKEWKLRPGIDITSEVENTGSGHYFLNERQGESGYTEWYGYGNGHYSSINTVTLKASIDGIQISVTEITKTEGNGKIGNPNDEKYAASLDIDVLTGNYSAGFDFPYGESTTLTRTVMGLPTSYKEISKLPQGLREIFLPMAMKAEEWATFSGDINDTSPMVGGMIGFQLFGDMDEPKEYQLPKSGLALRGSYHGKYISKTWSLIPSGKGKELILGKCDQSWLPEDQNNVKIAVKGNGLYGTEVKIRFTLFEITSEPGTCLNSKDEEKDPDLDFFHADNSESKFSTIERTQDGFIAETARAVKNATITVASRDFGAWGKLKAEAEVSGFWLPILTEDGKPYITVPLDESGGKENQIADQFEKDNSLNAGIDPKLDEEGPGKRGDGLSAYEEYRGFQIGRGNNHYRTNPKEPDLFLYPETRRLEQYLREIQNGFPANIKVHLIKENQYKFHMAINPNNNLHNLVIQHGLWILERRIEPGVVGRMYGKFGSPKSCHYCAIDFAEHHKLGYGNKKNFYITIVHEIFHGLNVYHHGPGHRYINIWGDSYQRERDGDQKFSAALYNGILSGDIRCVMSGRIFAAFYEDSPGRIAMDGPVAKHYIDTIDKIIFSHLCSQETGAGAGQNEQLGPATAGECKKTIQIADK